MISRIWDGVREAFGKAADAVLAVMKAPAAKAVVAVTAVCAAFSGAVAFADQGGTTVEFTPIVNFGELFTSITTAIAPLVAGALGLGLAIWGASYIFSVIRRMAR
jgi:hypothetical protein